MMKMKREGKDLKRLILPEYHLIKKKKKERKGNWIKQKGNRTIQKAIRKLVLIWILIIMMMAMTKEKFNKTN